MFTKMILLLTFILSITNASDNIIKKNIKNPKIFLDKKRTNGDVSYYIVNNSLYDILFEFDAKIKNAITSDTLPIKNLVKAKSKRFVTKFFFVDSKASIKAKFTYAIGNNKSRHNNNYLYRLPYENNTSYFVSQGFNGKFSHKGGSLYAVDFQMKVGTKIFAAREGILVQLKENSNKGGDKKYISDANYITIKHKDGTYSKYAHLKQDGVIPKLGDKIKRGQHIGYSGNTGYSNGPHLHFVVFKGKNYKSRNSLKIKFISKKAVISDPIKGKKYIAIN